MNVVGVDDGAPAFEDLHELKLGVLHGLEETLSFKDVENGPDVLFGFRVVDDVLVEVDLQQDSFDQFIYKLLPGDLQLLQHFLVINDTLDDLELFPLDQPFEIAQQQFPFSHFIINIFLQIQQDGHHVPAIIE
jgi:hypothetical protein